MRDERAEPSVFNEEKLCELILYIADRSAGDKRFGKTKLLKLLAYSDFEAYQRLGRPITGAHYRKLPHGPAPREAPLALEILEERDEIEEAPVTFFGRAQRRYRARRPARPELFTRDELAIVDEILERFKHYSGSDIAHASHKDFIGWQMAGELEEIPYRTALIAIDEQPSAATLAAGREHLARL
jgi:hypothetical protein